MMPVTNESPGKSLRKLGYVASQQCAYLNGLLSTQSSTASSHTALSNMRHYVTFTLDSLDSCPQFYCILSAASLADTRRISCKCGEVTASKVTDL